MKFRRALLGLVLLLATALLSISWWIPLLVYRPERLAAPDPRLWQLPEAQSVSFRSEGKRLVGWWVPPPKSDGVVVLLVHGRWGNISTRSEIVSRLSRERLGVLAFDYQGYGASEGSPSEDALAADTHSAYRWLAGRNVDASRLIVIGQSLGGSLAASQPIGILVLVSPYASLPEVASERVKWLPLTIPPWPSNRFEVERHVAAFSGAVILVASAADGLVPLENSRALARAAKRPIWIRADESHHDGLLLAVIRDGSLMRAVRAASQVEAPHRQD